MDPVEPLDGAPRDEMQAPVVRGSQLEHAVELRALRDTEPGHARASLHDLANNRPKVGHGARIIVGPEAHDQPTIGMSQYPMKTDAA